MGKERNTGDLAHQVSCGYIGICLELDLQMTHHHPMVLLGSFPWRKLYHHSKHLWGMGLQQVWVWWGNRGCSVLKIKHLLPWGCDFCHECWCVRCNICWVSHVSHYPNLWTPIGGRWCCDICICKVRTLHGALELLVIIRSLQGWRINHPSWRNGKFLVLCWEGWGHWNFHFHCHNLCLPVWAQLQKYHSGWSQSDWNCFFW